MADIRSVSGRHPVCQVADMRSASGRYRNSQSEGTGLLNIITYVILSTIEDELYCGLTYSIVLTIEDELHYALTYVILSTIEDEL